MTFVTLDSMLLGWERAVRWLAEPPTAWDIAEWDNELDRRDSLEAALSLLSISGRASLAQRVAGADQFFAEATVAAERSFPGPWRPRAWWWYRKSALSDD